VLVQTDLMKNLYTALAVMGIGLCTISCTKEQAPSVLKLDGDYDFISFHSFSEETDQYNSTDGTHIDKASAEHNSYDHAGVVNISDTIMQANGIAYTYKFTGREQHLVNQQLVDSSMAVDYFQMPPANFRTSFTTAGSDSLQFNEHSPFYGATYGVTENGARITLDGNFLIISNNQDKDSSYTTAGVTHTVHIATLVEMKLQHR
jgi:hypothetical protein